MKSSQINSSELFNSEKNTSEFSIIRGGLLEKILLMLRIATNENEHTLRKIIFFVMIGWAPLLILSGIEGNLWGIHIQAPFIKEFATHIRILVAIPIMILSESIIDIRIKNIVNQFVNAKLIQEDGMEQFELAKQKTDRMCESVWAEVIILVLIIVNVIIRFIKNSTGFSSWIFPDSAHIQSLSVAGYWMAVVSLPLFQFFLLRWIWRWILWVRLLYLISKTKLHLNAAHPDRACGLGFLGAHPLTFGPVTFVLGLVFAAVIGEYVFFSNLKLNEYHPVIIVFALICILINVVPLLPFAMPISHFKHEGIYEYSSIISKIQHSFNAKWIKKQ